MANEVNISGLERSVADVVAVTQRIEQKMDNTNAKLDSVTENIEAVSEELKLLKSDFVRYMDESKKVTLLQKAATELVRVRQELEQNFGNYKVVRETMLGVLQATDLALVKKTTIAQVTEELMLATPDYWLAPCLVAVAAWVGNDRDLADRAIAEAARRDESKTALTMALICRRNNRTVACFEWLSIYFSGQSATNFTESNFTYLNAYLNGVFGPDEKHMCDDYVARWMREAQSDGEDFETKQVSQWQAYCSEFTVDLDAQFPRLSSCVSEYSRINAYVSRINSIDRIANDFSQMQNVKVDHQELKIDIDKTLIDLISRYDQKEEPLRKEEAYLNALRHFDGDIVAAKASILEAKRRQKEDTIDLISQMTNIIVNKDHARHSERKTAVNYLSGYIKNGFKGYITEKKTGFPTQIKLEVEGWSGTTTDGSNCKSLQNSFADHMGQERKKELNAIAAHRPQQMKIAAIILAALGGLGLFFFLPLGLLCFATSAFCYFKSTQLAKQIAQTIALTNANLDSKTITGKEEIAATIAEWQQAKAMVQKFEAEAQRDIVA